jgi:drug/metabolite transporter (DMT)-like permease
MNHTNPKLGPILKALVAALLFGASAPLAKALLQDVAPIPLAALLYLGCGAGALLMALVFRSRNGDEAEAPLATNDLPWLAGAIIAGGVAAPIILMFSLTATPAGTASLLLNFEGVATALIAGLAFREAIGRLAWAAIALVTLGSIILSWNANVSWGFSAGALGVMLACALWGLDNNLTRHISAKNPLTIVTVKGLAAGTFSLVLALALGNRIPEPVTAVKALLLGSVSYGLSIALFVMALRDLGAARTSALYATAPFLGMVLAITVFGEQLEPAFLFAIPLMVGGAVLLLRENHGHWHEHEALEHEHGHDHADSHHAHLDRHPEQASDLRHSHLHQHEPVRHLHPHTPDIHHRHEHHDQ